MGLPADLMIGSGSSSFGFSIATTQTDVATATTDLGLELLERWHDRPAIVYQIHRALLWDRRVEQAGVVRVDNLTQMFPTASVLAHQPLPRATSPSEN